LKGLDIVQLWLEEEERALDAGYNGLRIAGNTSFLTPGDWSTFMEYEQAVTAGFSGRRIVALCSYALAHCNDQQMSDVMHAHHCALERPDADWQMVSGGDLIASGSAPVAAHRGNGSPAMVPGSSPAPVSDGSSTRAEPVREAPSAAPLSLAEAHHRIANNLEVISSLVRLQASDLTKKKRSLTAQEVRQILDEVAGRITTVALLHRLLSRRPEQEVIDLGSYLRGVCDSLVGALAFRGQVEMSNLQDGLCHVRADHAAPLAVVVSELVTNAIKYGRPNGAPGRIAVSCHRASDGSLALEISDDGVGLPAGFDPAVDGGLGFRVVRALAQQLGATLAFESTELGLTVRVGIPGLLQ
jgi:two-component sensor histidine kinase